MPLCSKFKNWSKEERAKFNKSALELNCEQGGPDGRSYGYWISVISDLAIGGLKNRKLKEEKFFEGFYNLVMDSGPFSLQRQMIAPRYSS